MHMRVHLMEFSQSKHTHVTSTPMGPLSGHHNQTRTTAILTSAAAHGLCPNFMST